jgi:hypothetical protein
MFNILLIHDNLDNNRGEYFSASHQNMVDKLSTLDLPHLQSLNTKQCLANTIDHYSISFNGHPFIFIAYVHGSEDALYISDKKYIHEQNAYLFSGTLFYACSCLSAKRLGVNLRNEGCRIFAGYDAKISSLDPECEPVFFECENALLTHFLTTNDTIQESLDFMYRKFEEMRYQLINDYGIFTSSILENNLNAFKLFCNDQDRSLTKHHFE